MSKDRDEEIRQLKRDYFEMVEAHREEREALLTVINTFGLLASGQDDVVEDIQAVKGMIAPDGDLPIDEIAQAVRRIKARIIAREEGAESGNEELDRLRDLEGRVIEACRVLKRIMAAILEDFYPMTEEMEASAKEIVIDCMGDIGGIELKKPSEDLLDFIQKIKLKISEDFKDINNFFFTLLEQAKELEKAISSEFAGDKPLKEVEYFEMKINREVGSIADSFNVYTTISEVKKVVVEKLKNIKVLVALRKKEEIRKSQVARENVKKLKKRINDVEKKAKNLSRKADRFQQVAMKDGLTGLFSRNAFHLRVKEAINSFKEKGEPFSLILFDVDKFKSVNDTLGHVAGDKVLKKVAECLEETFRKDDFIARYGGDEFVVLIEGFTEKMALDRIPVFNEKLGKIRFVSYREGDIKLTVSAGTTEAMEGDNLESLIGRADKAMYAIKEEKRA